MAIRINQRQIRNSKNLGSLRDELLTLHNNVDYIRASVPTFLDLPYPESSDGILRLVREEKSLYQWVAAEKAWIRISSSDEKEALGSAFFREVHNTVANQSSIRIGNSLPFRDTQLMVFVDGQLKEYGKDYLFTDTRNMKFMQKFNAGQKVTLFLPGVVQETRLQSETVFEYNADGNVVKSTITGDVNRITEYTYDGNFNITKESVTDILDGDKKERTYTYDSNNNVTRVKDDGVDVIYVHKVSDVAIDRGRGVGNYTVSCKYDAFNRLELAIYTGEISRREEYFYNKHGLLHTKVTYENNQIVTENYRYDEKKRMTQKEVSVYRNAFYDSEV